MQRSDTLPDLAHRFSLGYYEIIRANPGVDVWLPERAGSCAPGRRILPAGPREGLVVNLPEHRLYITQAPPGREAVFITYPVSIGKMDWRTPLGETRVIARSNTRLVSAGVDPQGARREWRSAAEVWAGPDNPLGDFALRLAAGNGEYMLHGTNNPTGSAWRSRTAASACTRKTSLRSLRWCHRNPGATGQRAGEGRLGRGQLLLEAHPPVDAEGQSIEPDVQLLSQMLDQASAAVPRHSLGSGTCDARGASGIPTLVGLAADPEAVPAPPRRRPACRRPRTERRCAPPRPGRTPIRVLRAARARRARMSDETQQLRGARDQRHRGADEHQQRQHFARAPRQHEPASTAIQASGCREACCPRRPRAGRSRLMRA